MLDKRHVPDFVAQLDLDAVQACPMCLFDLAWQMRTSGAPPTGLLQRTAGDVWPEIELELLAAVVDARMREVVHAEQALADLDERAWRTPLVRAVVVRLAQRMVDEMAQRDAG